MYISTDPGPSSLPINDNASYDQMTVARSAAPADPRACKGWSPGSGQHTYLMNPMREFVHNDDAHVEAAFAEFQTRHGRSYSDAHEHSRRRNHYRHNLRSVLQL